MSKHVLITGGGGFIGSHLADELLSCGYRVRILDNLAPQVHGPHAQRPSYLNSKTEFVLGDIRDPSAIDHALQDIDAVFHLAACVGVGQSMYEIARYTDINSLGTAVLLEALIRRPVERLIVASSMSIYGEGLYCTPDGMPTTKVERSIEQLRAREWELKNERGELLTPLPTPETQTPSLTSVYALSKFDQEQMCLLFGRTYNIPTVALRFFNTYGTRQALSNPYTGVLAIFASRYLNDRPPLIFEDGYQQRDFVNVRDVTQACRLALEVEQAAGQVFNVASGQRYTVREVVEKMGHVLGKEHIIPEITGSYRAGDVRHCFADITRARTVFGYTPRVALEDGLAELAAWLQDQVAIDRVPVMNAELARRGLRV